MNWLQELRKRWWDDDRGTLLFLAFVFGVAIFAAYLLIQKYIVAFGPAFFPTSPPPTVETTSPATPQQLRVKKVAGKELVIELLPAQAVEVQPSAAELLGQK